MEAEVAAKRPELELVRRGAARRRREVEEANIAFVFTKKEFGRRKIALSDADKSGNVGTAW